VRRMKHRFGDRLMWRIRSGAAIAHSRGNQLTPIPVVTIHGGPSSAVGQHAGGCPVHLHEPLGECHAPLHRRIAGRRLLEDRAQSRLTALGLKLPSDEAVLPPRRSHRPGVPPATDAWLR